MLSILTVLAASLVIFFRNINSYPLRNWDEAWYAQIIQNMASGKYHLLMPFWNGRYYFGHSPLYFWFSTPVVKFFGLGEWQVRLISALCAVAVTLLIFMIAKKLKGEKLGLISVLVFLTLGQVVIRFAHGNLDSLLLSLFLASFYFYLKSEDSKPFSILCGVFLGLGILVKSWGIGLFPLALIFTYSLIKNRSLPKNFKIIIIFTFLTFVWWYVWGIREFGKDFISWFVLNPAEGRLANPIDNFSLYYFKALFRDIGFWFIPLLIGTVLSLKRIKNIFNPPLTSYLIVSAIYLTFLNFLSDKSDWYNLPAYPLISIVIAYFILKIFEKSKKLALFLVILVTLGGIWNINRIENIYPDRSKVGADLGKHASQLIPLESKVILDDHDFTSFLFYSNQGIVFTLEDNKKSDFSEWWKIHHNDLQKFIKTNQNVWIITPDPQKLGLNSKYFEYQEKFNTYYFLKINPNP